MFNTIAEQIFNTELTSIDWIDRFNKTPTIKRETVSQHSYWVILFSRLIAAAYTKKPNFTFIIACVDAAITHDYDETITGDVLFDFKHNLLNGEEVCKLIDDYVSSKLADDHFDNIEMSEYITASLKLQKENKLVKAVIKVADWLACLKYEYQELNLGNKAFISILDKSLSGYQKAVTNLKNEAVVDGQDINEKFFKHLTNNVKYERFFN